MGTPWNGCTFNVTLPPAHKKRTIVYDMVTGGKSSIYVMVLIPEAGTHTPLTVTKFIVCTRRLLLFRRGDDCRCKGLRCNADSSEHTMKLVISDEAMAELVYVAWLNHDATMRRLT